MLLRSILTDKESHWSIDSNVQVLEEREIPRKRGPVQRVFFLQSYGGNVRGIHERSGTRLTKVDVCPKSRTQNCLSRACIWVSASRISLADNRNFGFGEPDEFQANRRHRASTAGPLAVP